LTIFDIFGCFFTWQQRFESPVKDSNLSLSRKISQKIRIFESGFADSIQHYDRQTDGRTRGRIEEPTDDDDVHTARTNDQRAEDGREREREDRNAKERKGRGWQQQPTYTNLKPRGGISMILSQGCPMAEHKLIILAGEVGGEYYVNLICGRGNMSTKTNIPTKCYLLTPGIVRPSSSFSARSVRLMERKE
jgi:hypothetical protein